MRAVLVHVIPMMLLIRYVGFPIYVAVKPVEFIYGAHKVGMNVIVLRISSMAPSPSITIYHY